MCGPYPLLRPVILPEKAPPPTEPESIFTAELVAALTPSVDWGERVAARIEVFREWSGRSDLNGRPAASEAAALPD